MKTASLTITGVLGPGVEVTTLEFDSVTGIKYSFKDNTIDVEVNDKHTFFDYDETATITMTISGNHTTITIA